MTAACDHCDDTGEVWEPSGMDYEAGHMIPCANCQTDSAATCCERVYFCPTSGETECPVHGGFDACCDRPDLHRPVASAAQRWPKPVAHPLPGFRLEHPHPLAGREAFQCVTCDGIFYPDPTVAALACPYCEDDE